MYTARIGAFDDYPDDVIVYESKTGSVLHIGKRVPYLLGCIDSDLSSQLSNGFYSLICADDRYAAQHGLSTLLARTGSAQEEYRIQRPDGTLTAVRDSSVLISGSDGGILVKARLTRLDRTEEIPLQYADILNKIASATVIYRVTDKVETVFVSNQVLELFGTDRSGFDALTYGNKLPFIYCCDEFINKFIPNYFSSGKPHKNMVSVTLGDGSERWIRTLTTVERLDDSYFLYITMFDATDERTIEQEERRLYERYRIISEYSGIRTFELDVNADRMTYNLSGGGDGCHAPIEHYFSELDSSTVIERDSIPTVRAVFERALKEKINGTFEYQADITGDGCRWWRADYVSLADTDGKVYSVIGRLDDIQEQHDRDTKRSDLEAALLRRAETDMLTGIYNKSTAQEKIRSFLNSQRCGTHCTLFIIDIDNFKLINDTKGHYFGDVFLKAVAGALKKCFRDADIIGRFGGDEFIIFMPQNGDKRLVDRKCSQILRAISRLSEEPDFSVSCSIGAVIIAADDNEYEAVFTRADAALYQAKNKGKNGYVIYSGGSTEIITPIVDHTAMDTTATPLRSNDSLTTMLFNMLLNSNDTDDSIRMILESLGSSLNADRVYIVDNSTDNTILHLISQWNRPGTKKPSECFSAADAGYVFNELRLSSFYYKRSSDRPETESALYCALICHNSVVGFVGFDCLEKDRYWTQEQVETMCLAANIISIFIEKKHCKDLCSRGTRSMLSTFDSIAFPALLLDTGRTIMRCSKYAAPVFGQLVGSSCDALCGHTYEPKLCADCAIHRALNGISGCCSEIGDRNAAAELVTLPVAKIVLVAFDRD